ncbi:MAG: BamA/TamA family outer membrane protein [Bacteroidota bacterium]
MKSKVNRSVTIKYQFVIVLIVCCCFFQTSLAQYHLKINYVDKDSSFNPQSIKLSTNFLSVFKRQEYINSLPKLLQMQGYPLASLDSINYIDSAAILQLYLGKQYNKFNLRTEGINKEVFSAIHFNNRSLAIADVNSLQQSILEYFDNNGYPFAKVFLDSIQFDEKEMSALLKVDKGVLYHIDSIRVYGKAKIANNFLQHYLNISNGSIYKKDKLLQVSKRLLELPYLQEQQPWDVTLLGTGSILNLYLQPKPSSQINFLIGFLPADNLTGKLRLTGDVNLNLKNMFAAGETVLLNWQQLQDKSPRLNIGYQQPNVFNSPFGIDFLFDLFKKDSTFLQLNAQFGLQYLLSANQSGKIFFQKQSNTLLSSGVDTLAVKGSKKLPVNIDVSAVNMGLDYEWNNTNYKLNPLKGNEIKLVTSVGVKTIKRNNDILNLYDPSFNYASLYDSVKLKSYQFKVKVAAAHFFQVNKLSTVKTSLNLGFYNSPEIFRNDLFQIGGYKLLRGFDEESIYATRYAVAGVEYRYLLGLNSFLFVFSDAGFVKNEYQEIDLRNNFFSGGTGLAFETKLGLLNISFAVGKRNDVNFDLRRASKIHFGYINYF